MSKLSAFCVAAILTLPIFGAVAEDAVSSPPSVSELFAAAIESAETQAQQRWAFSVTVRNLTDEDAPVFVRRFDPRQPEGERWLLLSHDIEALSKDERKALEAQGDDDEADTDLIYDGLSNFAEEVKLVGDASGLATFEFKMSDPEVPKKMVEAIKGRAVLDKKGGYISLVELVSTKSFKPHPAAKIKLFRQTQHYIKLVSDGPAVLADTEMEISGKAMFQDFSQHFRIEYADIEPVDAPPFQVNK